MEIAIIGLNQSGKTTVFNAVTKGKAEVASFGGKSNKPNIGVAKVPDGRFSQLNKIFKPQKITPAEIRFIDIPTAPEGLGESSGISGEYLNLLQRSDALALIIRAFQNPSVPHPSGKTNPQNDLETMLYELSFADIEILERRLEKLNTQLKSPKSDMKQSLLKEKSVLEQIKSQLEDGIHVREQNLTEDQQLSIKNFALLTNKPLMVVININEEQSEHVANIYQEINDLIERPSIKTTALAAQLEMELTEMEPEDEKDFRESLSITESGLDQMVRLTYDLLNLITFFTVGEDENRAWPIQAGTVAVDAAGQIHSDIQKGFIRGEVISFDDLIECDGMTDAKTKGLIRQEGRSYEMKDGDIMHVLFNV